MSERRGPLRRESTRQPRRPEPRALRHGRLSPRRRLALSARRRRSIRPGRSFFDRPSTDVAAGFEPARPPSTTTHHAAISNRPERLPHHPSSIPTCGDGEEPSAWNESHHLGHDLWSPAVPGCPGPVSRFPTTCLQAVGLRARPPPLALTRFDRRSRPMVLPNSMHRERTRDGPNPSHEAGQPLSPVARPAPPHPQRRCDATGPTSRVTVPGGPALMIHA